LGIIESHADVIIRVFSWRCAIGTLNILMAELTVFILILSLLGGGGEEAAVEVQK
jgi:hypothetical protein